MRHEINFQETGLRIAPISERSDRDHSSDGVCTMTTRAASSIWHARASEKAIDRGRPYNQQLAANNLVEAKVSVALKSRNEQREKR